MGFLINTLLLSQNFGEKLLSSDSFVKCYDLNIKIITDEYQRAFIFTFLYITHSNFVIVFIFVLCVYDPFTCSDSLVQAEMT